MSTSTETRVGTLADYAHHRDWCPTRLHRDNSCRCGLSEAIEAHTSMLSRVWRVLRVVSELDDLMQAGEIGALSPEGAALLKQFREQYGKLRKS